MAKFLSAMFCKGLVTGVFESYGPVIAFGICVVIFSVAWGCSKISARRPLFLNHGLNPEVIASIRKLERIERAEAFRPDDGTEN